MGDVTGDAMRSLLDRPGRRAMRALAELADRRILDDLGPTRDPATDPTRCTFTSDAGRCYLNGGHLYAHIVPEVRQA